MADVQVQSLLLCQTALHDSLTGSYSAIGIFDHIKAKTFEQPLFTNFMIMAMYRGGRKGERLSLKMSGVDPTTRPTPLFDMIITDPDPVTASFFHVRFPGFVIMEPGVISFELSALIGEHEYHLSTARLTAVLVPPDPAKQA